MEEIISSVNSNISDENIDEVLNKFNIKKAPTLLVPKMGGYDIFENVSFIKQYIESRN